MKPKMIIAPALIEGLFQLSDGKFDFLSALVGAGVAAVVAFLLYRLRNRITAARKMGQSLAQNYSVRATRGHGARYADSVIAQANRWHVAGHLVSLEQVAIMPEFLVASRPYDPLGIEAEEESPYRIVPLVLDFAQTVGPYHLPSVDLQHVLRGSRGLALLGAPGSGRSTALGLIAMMAARQTSAEQEDGVLSELRTPVLFHLGDVDLSPQVLVEDVDPAQIMVDAVRKRMSGAAARSAPDIILPEIVDGRCLILADGWDELPTDQRNKTLEWLIALMQTYSGNNIVVTGPTRGYGPLVESGLAPVYLRPWSDGDYRKLAQRWAEAWPIIEGRRKRDEQTEIDEETVRQVALGNRSRNPLDVTLKIWSTYADEERVGRRGWYSAYVDRMLPVEQGREALQRLAAEEVQSGGNNDDMLGHPLDDVKAYLDAALARAGRMAMDTPDFIHEVTNKQPILVERSGGRIAFLHPLIGSFLAAEALAASGRFDDLYGANGAVETVIPFLAAISDITPLVEERLSRESEVLYDNLLGMAAWMADAPADALWRDELLNRMSEVMLAPAQFPVVRERIMAALIASRDHNTASILQNGLQSEDSLARTLSILGMGALGDPALIESVAVGLDDATDIRAQVASTVALGAIGGEVATEYLVQLLFEGNDLVRQAAAEALAADSEIGHDLLREAVKEEDVLVRRGAIYGLARVSEPWALAILEEIQIEDEQWFVRDAARDMVERFESDTAQRPPTYYLAPVQIRWLVDWAAEREETVPGGEQGIEMLISALQDVDANHRIRRAAADTLGKLGRWESVKPLYAALRDESPQVRELAYRALASISEALGEPLPAVV